MPKHDTSGPILVLVRRGRRNRGFSVSPVEDISNAALCADEKDLGEAIVEMLDDDEQPRVDLQALLEGGKSEGPKPSSRDDESDEDDEEHDDDEGDEGEDDDDDEEEGVDPHEGTLLEGVSGASGEEVADRIMFNLFNAAVTKGRSMSSKKVRDRGTRKNKKKRRRTRT